MSRDISELAGASHEDMQAADSLVTAFRYAFELDDVDMEEELMRYAFSLGMSALTASSIRRVARSEEIDNVDWRIYGEDI